VKSARQDSYQSARAIVENLLPSTLFSIGSGRSLSIFRQRQMLKLVSILGLLVMAAALIGLFAIDSIFSRSPIVIGLQVIAVALMIWARLTFGGRSFHASADPTAGGLVTTGPYRYIRHPIYTAACLLGWGGIVVHWSWLSVALGVALFGGGLVRMLCEERLLREAYPDYSRYSRVTKRMLPYVF
jgi:protein-S-isoprenylcysteine O-methyltransferase Ste14